MLLNGIVKLIVESLSRKGDSPLRGLVELDHYLMAELDHYLMAESNDQRSLKHMCYINRESNIL